MRRESPECQPGQVETRRLTESLHGSPGVHRPLIDPDVVGMLRYPIRDILAVVEGLKECGVSPDKFKYANIGDPNANGWEPPPYAGQVILETLYDLRLSDKTKREIGTAIYSGIAKGSITAENVIQEVLLRIFAREVSIKGLDQNIINEMRTGDPSRAVDTVLKRVFSAVFELDGRNFGYAPSTGLNKTKEWIIEERKKQDSGSELGLNDVVFVNGAADGLYLVRASKDQSVRIATSAPGYPATIAYEAALSRQDPVLFKLQEDDNWQPDFDDIDSTVRQHERCLGGISIVRIGNNPTGSVLSDESVEKIAKLCARYGLFLEDDATYEKLLPDGVNLTPLTEIARAYGVPVIVHGSGSKALCVPGLRAGWIEFHRHEGGENFDRLIEAVKQAVTVRVGSGILGQLLLPRLFSHPEFASYNKQMVSALGKAASEMAKFFNKIPGMKCTAPVVPFYVAPYFQTGALKDKQSIPIKDERARAFVESIISNPEKCHPERPDERLCVYLAGGDNANIVVPQLSGFKGPNGVRFTALNRDPEKRRELLECFKKAVTRYLNSAQTA